MTWVRTEDSMPLHPKILRLSDGAFRLWENGLHFANRGATNGRIEKVFVPSLNHHGRWTPDQVAEFVAELERELWIDSGDHYQIHDYEHHQAEALKDRVERKKEFARERQQRRRERALESERESLGIPKRDVTRDGQRDGQREFPVPSRPVPSRPENTPCSPDAHADSAPPEPTRLSGAERQGIALSTPIDDLKLQDSLVVAFCRGWHSVTGRHLGTPARHERTRSADLLVWARAASPADPAAAVERAARGAAADPAVVAMAMPWAAFCKQPGKYLPSESVDDKIVSEIRRLADESRKFAELASVALKRGDRAERSRLNAESERAAQECERLKRQAVAS